MADVSQKDVTYRTAKAAGVIHMNEAAYSAVMDGAAPKGDVLAAARIAGIMAAKKTYELIPLCHMLPLSFCGAEFFPNDERRCIKCVFTAKTTARTGVEMEALTGVSAALLTVYDMCKALDRGMIISDVHLLEKHGGKSGDYFND